MTARAVDEPLATYDQAVWRLVMHYLQSGETIRQKGDLPFAFHLVSEIFWVNPERVRRDFFKAWASV